MRRFIKNLLKGGADVYELENRCTDLSHELHELGKRCSELSQEVTELRAASRALTLSSLLEGRGDYRIPFWYDHNYWEPTVQLALRDLCRPGDVVFDVGANAGGLTVPMSRLIGPRGVVCAFEASRRIIDKTLYNIAVNGCGNVQIFHNAVSNKSGNLVEIYAGSHLNDSIIDRHGAPTGTFVDTLALDDFVAHWGLVPALVKMDIEGSEFSAIKGFERTIEQHRPHLILEQQPQDMRCHEMLTSLRYRAIDLATYKEIQSSDDFTPGAVVANVLFIHETAANTPYRSPIERSLTADLSKNQLGHIKLNSGRYLFEVEMSATGSDNEMMTGISEGDTPLFRYHTNTSFLASSYRDWPIHLMRDSTVRLFFDFKNGTRDHTFRVDGAKVWRLHGFDKSP